MNGASVLDQRPTQHTLGSPIRFSGVGLHSGIEATVTLLPAAPDTGIRFRRTDLAVPVEIAASWENTVPAALCTVLVKPDRRAGDTAAACPVSAAGVMTVEHLMAALAGCGIDNAVVEVAGPEIPIMDGSAGPFVFLIDCAGRTPQNAPRRAIRILRRVEVSEGPSFAYLEPSLDPEPGFGIACEIDFASPVIGRQTARLEVEPAAFKREIARARSFGFLEDVDRLRAAGRALGGSLDNVIVIDGNVVLNKGGLRYRDEFVRHKLLDALGDLALAGAPLIGRFHASRPSHALTGRLLARFFADRSNWRRETAEPAVNSARLREARPYESLAVAL